MKSATISFSEMWESKPFRAQLGAVTLLAIVFGSVAYMVTDQSHPYEFDEYKSKFIPPVVSAPSKARVEWKIEKDRYCPGTITKQIIDPITKTVVKSYIPVKTVENKPNDIPGWLRPSEFDIPHDVPNGSYGYRADLCYACNVLQRYIVAARICYSTPVLAFKIER